MNGTKAAVQSVGFWGSLIAALVMVSGLFGIDIAADVAGLDALIADSVTKGVLLFGVLAGLYGRLSAKKAITGVLVAK